MTLPISILVGTMTGTSELVAGDVQRVLEEAGRQVAIEPMDQLKADAFDRPGAFIICVSTYGQGDVPDNARDFIADLRQQKPSLAGKKFGVIALGDSTYADTYNFAGRQFDELMLELGGERVIERAECNASGSELPEAIGTSWAVKFAERLD